MRRPTAHTQQLIAALIAIWFLLVFDNVVPALGLLVGAVCTRLMPPSPSVATRELLGVCVVAIIMLVVVMGVSAWLNGPVF